jgi:hypothetical protein
MNVLKIIGGVVATLRSFNNEGIARLWLEQDEPLILADLRRAQ